MYDFSPNGKILKRLFNIHSLVPGQPSSISHFALSTHMENSKAMSNQKITLNEFPLLRVWLILDLFETEQIKISFFNA